MRCHPSSWRALVLIPAWLIACPVLATLVLPAPVARTTLPAPGGTMTLPAPGAPMTLPAPKIITVSGHQLPTPKFNVADHNDVVTLESAILLGLRMSPAIVNARLSRVTQKFALQTQRNAFAPQFTLDGMSFNRDYLGSSKFETTTVSLTPQLKYANEYGTTFTATMDDEITRPETGQRTNITNATFSITQPLLKGAGKAVVTSALVGAEETERMNQMTFRHTIASQINSIITAYHGLIKDILAVRINEQTVRNAEDSVRRFKIRLKVGTRPGDDLVTQESSVASARVQLEQAKRTVQNDMQTFLQLLGLNPNMPFKPDLSLDRFVMKPVPSKDECMRLAMAASTTYQQALQGVASAKRGLVVAKNRQLWQVDLSAKTQLAHGWGQGVAEGTPKKWMGPTTHSSTGDKSVGLTVSIPIDSLSNKQALTGARVGLEQAHQTLASAKLTLESNVKSALYGLQSSKYAYTLAVRAVKLAERSLHNAELRFKFGKTTAFEVESMRKSVTTDRINVVTAKIAYIAAYQKVRLLLGKVLDDWHISVKT